MFFFHNVQKTAWNESFVEKVFEMWEKKRYFAVQNFIYLIILQLWKKY